MPRCPSCHRRLAPDAACPNDGGRDGSPVPARAPAGEKPLLEGFTLHDPLGTGAMGAVWAATRQSDGLEVALKVVHATDAQAARRFEAEVGQMRQVAPPFAPAVYQHGALADGRPFVAMQKLLGKSLGEALELMSGPASLERFEALARGVLSAAAAMHQAKVVHRDLKPENVFLIAPAFDSAAIIDFGVAQAADQPFQPGEVVGTPEYSSPEQIEATDQVDARSDVYALGVMLYELVTLRLPFTGETRELHYGHLSLRPPPPRQLRPELPQAIEEVILRALSKTPSARQPDAGVLLQEFEAAIREVRVAAPQAPTAEAPKAAGKARAGETHKVVLLFWVVGSTQQLRAQNVPKGFGGLVANLTDTTGVAVFTHQAGEHPGRRALKAAQAILEHCTGGKALIDVASVSMKPRADGTPRFLSAVFTKESAYPRAEDPSATLLSTSARDLLSDVPATPAPTREGFFVAKPHQTSNTINEAATELRDAITPLVGRVAELQALMAEASQAFSSCQARVATVVAEPGLGKSRLAVALLRALDITPGLRIIDLRAHEPMGRDSDELFAQLLRLVFGLPAQTTYALGREALLRHLGDLGELVLPGVALVMGWETPEAPNSQVAPGVLRANAARAAAEGLTLLASRGPVAVIIDDAQWADNAVLEALERATVEALPIWVCAFARPTFEAARPGWGERASHHHQLTLPPLRDEAAGALCRALLPPEAIVPESVIARLVARTNGSPQLLVDLLFGLKRDGLVRLQAGGSWYVATEVLDRLPDLPLVEWLATRELESLPTDLGAHARLAALLSLEFTFVEFEQILGLLERAAASAFPLDARVGLDRLRRARVLLRNDAGRFSFKNQLMRDALARTVADELRLPIHRAASAYYRGAAALPDAIRLPRLAHHAAQAGDRLEAARAALTAAERTRARHKYLEAELLYSQALEYLDDAPQTRTQRLSARRGRGVMRYRIARYDDSLTDFEAARALAAELGDVAAQAEVMLDEAMALDWLEEQHRSRSLAQQAQAIATDLDNPLLHARVRLAIGRSHVRFSQNEEAATWLRKAAADAEQLGDDGYEVLIASDLLLGFLLPFLGVEQEAAERLNRVQKMAQEQGDELHLSAMYLNRSCLWIMLNDPERFAADSSNVETIARRIGNLFSERHSQFNAAYFHYWRGEQALAEPFCLRAIVHDQRRFRHGVRPEASVLYARILWAKGQPDEARALVERIREGQARARDENKKEVLLPPNDELMLEVISKVLGLTPDTPWADILNHARELAQGQELIEVLEIRGIVAAREGDALSAKAAWREALEVGQRIPNVMCGRIRANLATLEATG